MKADGRFYFACAVMLLALPGCTHGIYAALPFPHLKPEIQNQV
jgi:hypothetical protein